MRAVLILGGRIPGKHSLLLRLGSAIAEIIFGAVNPSGNSGHSDDLRSSSKYYLDRKTSSVFPSLRRDYACVLQLLEGKSTY